MCFWLRQRFGQPSPLPSAAPLSRGRRSPAVVNSLLITVGGGGVQTVSNSCQRCTVSGLRARFCSCCLLLMSASREEIYTVHL